MRTFLSLLVLTMLVATLAPLTAAQEGDLLIGVTYSPFTSRDWDVATLKPDGTGMNTIVDNGGFSHGMRWSPDRSHIAFKADITATEFEIFVADSSGNNVLQLTDWNPSYNQ
ncbi:hypothetical protein GF356_02545, partial [candidate division GN15 bacterium]|nr:hypothetical protein [candidate division GN15 bacterium]